jgi:chromosome partitioning protein
MTLTQKTPPTLQTINSFLSANPSLTVLGLEREANIKGNALSKAIQSKAELSAMNSAKLLPVLEKYGYNPSGFKGKIISIVNNKGGVAKTTTTQILGESLANMGFRVLLIDLDPQGNLSYISNVTTERGQVADSLLDIQKPLATTPINANLSIAPSGLVLQNTESQLLTEVYNQHKLQKILSFIRDDYDFILIDTPPSLGLLTINALNASDSCIITVHPEATAVAGLNSIFDLINKINLYGGKLSVEGILFTLVENNTVHQGHKAAVRSGYSNFYIFKSEIKKSIDVAKVQAVGVQFFDFKNKSVVGSAYEAVAQEILAKNHTI